MSPRWGCSEKPEEEEVSMPSFLVSSIKKRGGNQILTMPGCTNQLKQGILKESSLKNLYEKSSQGLMAQPPTLKSPVTSFIMKTRKRNDPSQERRDLVHKKDFQNYLAN